MKRFIILVFIFSFVFISSCAPGVKEEDFSQSSGNEISTSEVKLTIDDALGRLVTFESIPQRIVVAGKQTPMIVDFLYLFSEVNEKIAGIENRSQKVEIFLEVIDPAALDKMNLEKFAGAEQIATLKPDLVLMKTTMQEEVGDLLEELEIPVFYLGLESVEQMYREIVSYGKLLDQDDRAQEVISLYQESEQAITKKISAVPESQKPRVLLLQYNDRSEEVAFEVPSAQWLQTDLIEMAGGIPVWKDAAIGGGWVTVNLEQIAVWNPEIIFIVKYSGNADEIAAKLLIDPIWSELEAAINGNIYGFPGDFIIWDQPDTRWILALKCLAKKIHPALFEGVNLLDEVYIFYGDYYGLEEIVIEKSIIPLITGNID